ncbi:MAG: DUF2088 domain-containing protein [Planctomycetes bacterium]|nr:DUF2088 domain-containing protein [Planctomycetota bacterium]
MNELSLKLIKIKQSFPNQLPGIEDVTAEVRRGLEGLSVSVKPGARVAIAVGSRGLANLTAIVRAVADTLKGMGADPFVIPAMGSHGGATAEGQQAMLENLGVSAETVGIPIRASMEVVTLDSGDLGHPVYMDRLAHESGGIVIINRIKLHTDFHGRYESGLMKMCVLGLGKHAQALEMHRLGLAGLRDRLAPTALCVLRTGKILFGLGVVENAREQTALIRALLPDAIPQEEPGLLDLARANLARLPVEAIDVLMVDRMGKDISGSGVDSNVIGRLLIRGYPEPETPDIRSLVVTDLTEATHGNAAGMGFADVITKRLADKIDHPVTSENVITSTFLERGKTPLVAQTSAKAYEIALRACGLADASRARVVRVQDTLHLEEVYVSASVYEELRGSPPDPQACEEMFQSDGELVPFQRRSWQSITG